MTAPFVTVTTYDLLDVSEDGFASLMEENGETREDLRCPDENSPDPTLGEKIRAAIANGKEVQVTVTKAMESEVITDYKESD